MNDQYNQYKPFINLLVKDLTSDQRQMVEEGTILGYINFEYTPEGLMTKPGHGYGTEYNGQDIARQSNDVHNSFSSDEFVMDQFGNVKRVQR